jgi:hypothetical protein
MTRPTRPISWISGAQKEFGRFPEEAQSICLAALTIAAEGGKADIARPMKGLVVYGVQLGAELWVVHAFPEEIHAGDQDAAARN